MNSATINFWLIQSKEKGLLICPAIVYDYAIDNLNNTNIKDAWDVNIQVPEGIEPDAVYTMIPDIITLRNLKFKASELDSLLRIERVQEKIKELNNKYITKSPSQLKNNW